MSHLVSLGSYLYGYGAGSSPNRKIDFFTDEEKISAEVQAQVEGAWTKICDVCEDAMSVEGASTSKKVEIMREARRLGQTTEYPPDQDFSELPHETKAGIIKSLDPKGFWRISITNDIGDNPRFEKVVRIHFYDPR